VPASALTPQLKAFIDRAVVPILVREYLAELASENQLAAAHESVAKLAGTIAFLPPGDARS